MAEELEELCRRMKLSDHEKHHICLRRERVIRSKQEAQHSILFKLLTIRPFNGEAFKSSVRTMWASPGGVTVRDITDNLFMAVFTTKDDMERIFVLSPWTFDKKLIQMVRFIGDLQPTAVKFTHAAFWIRIMNLPIKSMTREVGEDIGQAVGTLIDVDVPDERGIAWGRFLRIRVEMDLAIPLMRGCIVQVEETDPVWVDFRYEHLPTFCYRCGIIGHNGNECIAGRGSSKAAVFDRDQYGPWLRASPIRSHLSGRRREDADDGGSSDAQPQQTVIRGGNPKQGVAIHKPSHNEATSSANPGIKISNDLAPVSGSVEAAEADKDTPHVPIFREVQENLNTKTAGVEFQHTPTMSDIVIDVMPATSINHPDQMKRNTEVSAGGSEVSAIFEEHGMEMELSADVTPSTGDDNLLFNNESEGGNTVSSFSSKAHAPKSASWKKRARVQTQNNIGPHIPVQRLKGKRALTEVEEATNTEDGEPCKKKACKDGGVVIHDSELVEAVEQPHQSQ
jgi:hypothetical protein